MKNIFQFKKAMGSHPVYEYEWFNIILLLLACINHSPGILLQVDSSINIQVIMNNREDLSLCKLTKDNKMTFLCFVCYYLLMISGVVAIPYFMYWSCTYGTL